MKSLDLQKLPPGIDAHSVESAVTAYATANSNVSSASITVGAKDSDGNEVQLDGVFTRTPIGQVVFMVLGIVGKPLLERVRRGLAKRKAERLGRRNERRVAKGKAPLAPGERTVAGKIIADTVEALFQRLLADGLIKELGNGIWTRVGGGTYATKNALMDALSAEVPKATRKASTKAPAKATRKASNKAPAKATKKVAPKKVTGKK